jgi:hypothetical protein
MLKYKCTYKVVILSLCMHVCINALYFNNENVYITTPEDDPIRVETYSEHKLINYSCVDGGICIISYTHATGRKQ